MEQKIISKDSGCPSCGATMEYSPERQKLYCEKCQTCKDITISKEVVKTAWEDRPLILESQMKEYKAKEKKFKCPNCGADVILNALQFSSTCPYCETNLVANESNNFNITPNAIIPFTYSNQVAREKYIKGIKKKWFAPSKLKKHPPVENLKGIYVPIFSFDAKIDSVYDGVLEKDHKRTDSQGRTHTTTTRRHISGKHSCVLTDILIESSSEIDQQQLDKIKPYNFKDIYCYNNDFILGYNVESFTDSLDICKSRSEASMKDIVKQQILSKYSYDRVARFTMTSDFSEEKFLYNLLPIYKCDYKYKNKNYITIMNGQTGKVGGGYPKSPIKITLFVLFIIAIISAFVVPFVI